MHIFHRGFWRAPVAIVSLACMVVLVGSCTSTVDLSPVDAPHGRGDFAIAFDRYLDLEDRSIQYNGYLVHSLDAGLLAHADRQWEISNQYLSEADRLMHEAYTESVSANIASFIVNDTVRPYQGEDYENLYTNVFKAVNYLHLGDNSAAMVELRRATEKQDGLRMKYQRLEDTATSLLDTSDAVGALPDAQMVSSQFTTSALASYLGMLCSERLGDAQGTLFHRNRVLEAFRSQQRLYPFPVPQAVSDAEKSPASGRMRIDFLAFTGKSPIKWEEITYLETTPGNWAKFALPQLEGRPSEIASVTVEMESGQSLQLEQIEDLHAIATDAFLLQYAYTRTKTIVRSLIKSVGTSFVDALGDSLVEEAESADEEFAFRLLADITSLASKLIYHASERADLRISHYIPALAWVGSLECPAGTRTVRFIYKDWYGRTIRIDEQHLETSQGTRWLFLESICPN